MADESKDMGAGYNIPISLSAAQSYSVPQTLLTPTYFVFGSEGARVGGDISQNPSNINPATATSAAAQGDASAQTKDAGNVASGTGSKTNWGTIAAIGAVLAIVFLKR